MQARNVEVAQTTDGSRLMLLVRMVVLVLRTMMTTMTMTLRTFLNNGCIIDITMLIYEDVLHFGYNSIKFPYLFPLVAASCAQKRGRCHGHGKGGAGFFDPVRITWQHGGSRGCGDIRSCIHFSHAGIVVFVSFLNIIK